MTSAAVSRARRSDLGLDTIGWLRQQLIGLGGFVTMLYELVQNAEDEGRETSQCDEIEFEFTPDALIVRTGQPRLRIVRDPTHSGSYYAFDDPAANLRIAPSDPASMSQPSQRTEQ